MPSCKKDGLGSSHDSASQSSGHLTRGQQVLPAVELRFLRLQTQDDACSVLERL